METQSLPVCLQDHPQSSGPSAPQHSQTVTGPESPEERTVHTQDFRHVTLQNLIYVS